jgi:hypothetical protein
LAKKKLTPNQKEWQKEFDKLKRRVGDWRRKFHAVVDLPQKPERITKRDIERLKQMVWKNLDQATKAYARKEYEYRYENKVPEVYTPKPPYNPPTETDFINNNTIDTPESLSEPPEESDEAPDEDGYTETVVSRDEIEAWIDRNISSITVDTELDGVREKLENIVLEAADAYGDYSIYLSYLEGHAGELIKLAEGAIAGYIGYKGKVYQQDPTALNQFATILNMGRPLSQTQSERLENEGWVSYDFNE